MKIDFAINARVNLIYPLVEATRGRTFQIGSIPDLEEVICAVALELEARHDIEIPYEELDDDPGFIVHSGPGVYSLLDSTYPGTGRWMPQIIRIGAAQHVKSRVQHHRRNPDLIFNGARSVFIENKFMRHLIECQLIKYYRYHQDSPHADSITNLRP